MYIIFVALANKCQAQNGFDKKKPISIGSTRHPHENVIVGWHDTNEPQYQRPERVETFDIEHMQDIESAFFSIDIKNWSTTKEFIVCA